MLAFPENFFQEEDRCGFTVSSMMKSAWAAQMEVLQKVVEICGEENVRWYASWGTLLGAVRHEGFIPWDDDIDIAMPRADYMKFLETAKKHLPEGYRLLDVYHEPEWEQSFARVVNADTIDISQNRLQEFHGCPFVVGIDIFPLDEWVEDVPKREYQQNVLDVLQKTASLLLLAKVSDPEEKEEIGSVVAESVETLEESIGIQIDRTKNMLNQICRLYDQMCMEGDSQESSAYVIYDMTNDKYGCRLNKEWFNGAEAFPFECISVIVPGGYKEMLTEMYGDFMKPVRVAASHSYPFYKEQLEELRQRWPDFAVCDHDQSIVP